MSQSQRPHPQQQWQQPPQGHWARPGHAPPPPAGQPGGWAGTAPPPTSRGRLSRWLIVGLVALVASAVVVISVYHERSENGIVVECSDDNYGPFLFAPIAVVAGLLALTRRRRHPGGGSRQLLLALACIGLGLGQLLAAIADVNLTVHDDRCEVGGVSDDGFDGPTPLPPL